MNVLSLYSGGTFDPEHLGSNRYTIEDIAHALSLTCRFGGHGSEFYSVAQHSVLVASMVPREMRLAALLHDSSEAYLCDLPKAVKYSPYLEGYRLLEHTVEASIAATFRLSYPWPLEVKAADQSIARAEAVRLGLYTEAVWGAVRPTPFPLQLQGPQEAERDFLRFFRRLTEGRE